MVLIMVPVMDLHTKLRLRISFARKRVDTTSTEYLGATMEVQNSEVMDVHVLLLHVVYQEMFASYVSRKDVILASIETSQKSLCTT